MVKKYAVFQRIENNRRITKEENFDVLCHLEHALLLALRERGTLNAMQYRHAAEKLKQRRLERAGKLAQRGVGES